MTIPVVTYKPIETAPKDGRSVLVFGCWKNDDQFMEPVFGIQEAAWSDKYNIWDTGTGTRCVHAVAWVPLYITRYPLPKEAWSRTPEFTPDKNKMIFVLSGSTKNMLMKPFIVIDDKISYASLPKYHGVSVDWACYIGDGWYWSYVEEEMPPEIVVTDDPYSHYLSVKDRAEEV